MEKTPTQKESATAFSSELNIAESSPVGDTDGLVVPASCPSDLHDVPNYGQPCNSAANSCGMTNSGSIQCGGSCNAVTPSNDLCCSWIPKTTACSLYFPGTIGNISYEENSCNGTWRNPDNSGCITCNNACAASTCVGQSCTNNCGQPVAGTFPGTNVTSSANCADYGFGTGTGTITRNSCTNAVISYDNSTCVAAPACVPWAGGSCLGTANSCGIGSWGTYECNGSCNATIPSDSICPAPVTGVCAGTHNNCLAGTSQDNVDTFTEYRWTCMGTNGGANSPQCSESKSLPVDGVCNVLNNSCIAGAVRDDADTATEYRWTCMGTNGGADSPQCSESKGGGSCTPVWNPETQPCSLVAGNYGIPSNQTSGTASLSTNSCTLGTVYLGGCSVPSACSQVPASSMSCAAVAGTYGIPGTHTEGTATFTQDSCTSVRTYTGGCAVPSCVGTPYTVPCTAMAGTYGIPNNYTVGTANMTVNSCSGTSTYLGGCSAGPMTHTITASAGSGGFISPSGSVSVPTGANQTFTFYANYPYEVDTVTVNGTAIGSPSSYTFVNVRGNATINVTFRMGTTSGITQAQGCVISAGNGTCNGRISWTTASPVPPVEMSVNPAGYFSNNPAASNQIVPLTPGTHTVTLRDQGDIFEQAQMSAVCFGALFFNEGICQASGGTLSRSPATCAIPIGQSTCNVNFTWSSTLLTSPNIYNSRTNVIYSTAVSGVNQPFPVTFGNNRIYLRDGTTVKAPSVTVNATCANGGGWNSTTGVCDPGVPAANITVGSCQIPNGASTCNAQVSWTSSALTSTPSIQQNGVEFSNLSTMTVNPVVANVNRRPISHTSLGGSTFTFVHEGTTLETETRGAICQTGQGLTFNGTICTSVCVPTDTCAGHAADIANTCVGSNYTISDDGCGATVTCPGTRACDYNWKEISP